MSREAICRGRRSKAALRGKDEETAPREKIPRLPGEHFYSGDLGIFMSALTHPPSPAGDVVIDVAPPRGRHRIVLAGWIDLPGVVGEHGPTDQLSLRRLQVVIDVPGNPQLEDVALRVVRVHDGDLVLDRSEV